MGENGSFCTLAEPARHERTSSKESSPLNEKSQANLGIVFLSRELVIVTSLTGNKGAACRASNLWGIMYNKLRLDVMSFRK